MSAALLSKLIAAGTPADLVAEVALAFAQGEVALKAAAEPSAGALRTRRWRERHAASHVTPSDDCDAQVTGNVTAPSPDKSPPDPQKLTPTPPTHETRARGAAGWKCPEGVDPEHWRDYLTNRRTKRLGFTPTAYRQQLANLDSLSDDEWPPGRIVEFAAARGWGGIFDPRGRDDGRRSDTNGMGGHRRGGSGSRTIDAGLAFIADGFPH